MTFKSGNVESVSFNEGVVMVRLTEPMLPAYQGEGQRGARVVVLEFTPAAMDALVKLYGEAKEHPGGTQQRTSTALPWPSQRTGSDA